MRRAGLRTQRQLALASFALLLAAVGCGGSARVAYPGTHTGERALLPGPGAQVYSTAAVAEGDALQDPQGELQAAFELATRARQPRLRGDARLVQLSAFVADHISPEGTLPSQAAIDLAARHLGLVEPTPHFVVVGTDAPDGVAERLRDDLVALLDEHNYSHYGGIARRRDGFSLFVAALVFRFVELEPIPRSLPEGATIELSGTLTHGHSAPELAITQPDGKVVRGEPQRGERFQFRVRAAVRGIYRVELLGQGPLGITVVANFPVYVGEVPPTQAPLAQSEAGPADPAQAAQALLGMLNEERAKAGLPALALDAQLSAVADAHTADMLEHGFVAHVSKASGGAADRVTRAGIHTTIVLENIGRGYSLREVHDGLLSSPGHRGNILHEQVTHVGIGVRATPESGHTAYLVTEVFVRVTPPLSGRATEDLLAAINRARKARNLAALRSEPTLGGLAAQTAQRYFTSPHPSDDSVMQALRDELGRMTISARSVGAVMTVVGNLDDVAELDAALDPAASMIGIGLAQGTRADSATGAICAVLLIGQ